MVSRGRRQGNGPKLSPFLLCDIGMESILIRIPQVCFLQMVSGKVLSLTGNGSLGRDTEA